MPQEFLALYEARRPQGEQPHVLRPQPKIGEVWPLVHSPLSKVEFVFNLVNFLRVHFAFLVLFFEVSEFAHALGNLVPIDFGVVDFDPIGSDGNSLDIAPELTMFPHEHLLTK